MYSMYGIEESDASREKLCYIIWYLKKDNCGVKIFLSCVYYCEVNEHAMNPCNDSLLYSLYSDVHLFDEI